MGYLRFIWTALFVGVAFVLSIPLMLIDLLIGCFNSKAQDKMTGTVIRVAFKIVLFLSGTRIHLSGMENIPKDEAVLFIGNHRSFYDVLATYSIFPCPTAFIAKKEFGKVPFLSWWMRLYHNLFLDRKDIKQGLKIILKAIDYVKEGRSVCIFPEGTRNKSKEDMLEFHEGSFKVSSKSGCAIIPITMYNMSAVFEDHFPAISAEDVFIDFGKPIYPAELSKEDLKHLGAYVREVMLVKYNEQKKEYEELKSK